MVWRSVSAVFLFGLVDPVGFEPVPLALPFPALLMAVAAGGGAWRLGSRRPRVLIALLLPVVALPVGLALASLVAPILIPRYVLWAGVPFFLLAATAMGTLRQRLRPLATAAVLVLGLWNLEPYYHAEVKPHWVPALKAVWAAAGPCDALFLDRDTLHYAASILERLSTDPSPKPERLGAPVQVQQALAAGRRVWVIQGPLTWLPEGALEEDAAKFAEFGAPTLVQPFGKAVVIERFDPPVPVCDSRIIGDSAPAGQCRVL